MNRVLNVESDAHEAWIDVTAKVRAVLREAGAEEGVVTVFVPHTTCGITLQENADPPLKGDIDQALARLFPWTGDYRHCEDNTAAHLKAMTVGSSVQIPFCGGELQLGTWQGIYLLDFDGPRRRRVIVQVSA